jgi:hypothetical protein
MSRGETNVGVARAAQIIKNIEDNTSSSSWSLIDKNQKAAKQIHTD